MGQVSGGVEASEKGQQGTRCEGQAQPPTAWPHTAVAAHHLVVAPLRRHHDAADLLDLHVGRMKGGTAAKLSTLVQCAIENCHPPPHPLAPGMCCPAAAAAACSSTRLRVVRRADAVQQARNLGAQIGHCDELLQQVLRHHVRVAAVPDVVCIKQGRGGGSSEADSVSIQTLKRFRLVFRWHAPCTWAATTDRPGHPSAQQGRRTRVDVDVVDTQVQVGGGDGTHAPVRLTAECGLTMGRDRESVAQVSGAQSISIGPGVTGMTGWPALDSPAGGQYQAADAKSLNSCPICAACLLVGAGGGDDEVVSVHVCGLGGDRRHLPALPRLLLNLRNLLPLLAGRRDLRAQDDVADLRLRQWKES